MPFEVLAVWMDQSFGLVITFRRAGLRAGGNLVVGRAVLVLAMLKVLIVVVVPVWVVVSMLGSELVHLLRARSKVVWAAISSHRH